eukprot:3615028-Pyramimonas_sp.AAC.1
MAGVMIAAVKHVKMMLVAIPCAPPMMIAEVKPVAPWATGLDSGRAQKSPPADPLRLRRYATPAPPAPRCALSTTGTDSKLANRCALSTTVTERGRAQGLP